MNDLRDKQNQESILHHHQHDVSSYDRTLFGLRAKDKQEVRTKDIDDKIQHLAFLPWTVSREVGLTEILTGIEGSA